MARFLSLFLLVLGTLLGSSFSAGAATPASVVEATLACVGKPSCIIPVGPQVRKGTLANGLTYYIQRNPTPQRRIEMRLVVKAGSAMEDDDQIGLAHLLEHMAFNGSAHFKKNELVSYLQSIGLRFGADLNAYTSFNETVYMLPLPTTDPTEIAQGMTVLADWAGGLTLRDEDIDAERLIVLEEMRARKGVGERVRKQSMPFLLQGSRYVDRLPIGTETSIQGFKNEAVRRFYKEWYRPNLMAVIAVGDLDIDTMEQQIIARFSGLKNPENVRERALTRVAPHTNDAVLRLMDHELTQEILQVILPVRVEDEDSTYGTYRDASKVNLFNAMLARRLENRSQESDSPFLGATASMGNAVQGYNVFSTSVVAGRNGLKPGVDATFSVLNNVRDHGFHADELEQAKRNVLARMNNAHAEGDKTDSSAYAEEYTRSFLTQEAIPGIQAEWALLSAMFPTLTLEELNAYAKEVLPNPTTPIKVMYSNKSLKDAPSETDLLNMVKQRIQLPGVAVEASTASGPLMAVLPKPGKIVDSALDPSTQTHVWKLSNGLTVLVKPTELRDNQILLGATRFGGRSLYGVEDKMNAQFAINGARSMGLGPWSPTQLRDKLTGKVMALTVDMGTYAETVSGSSTPQDLESLLQLLQLHFQPARVDTALFKAYLQRAQDAARNNAEQPDAQFAQAVNDSLFGNHPRAPEVVTPALLASIDMERTVAIYNERFGSAQGFDFVFVGNVDLDATKALVEQYIATLPTGAIEHQAKDLGIRPVMAQRDIRVAKATEPKATATLTYAGVAPDDRREQYVLGLAMDVVNQRIVDVLRTREGLIYSGGASGSIAQVPTPLYLVRVVLPGAPEHVYAMYSTFLEEIAKLQKEGATPTELQKTYLSWYKVRAKQEQDNDFWLAQLMHQRQYQLPLEDILKTPDVIRGIRAEEIQAAVSRYLNTTNLMKAALVPAPDVRTSIDDAPPADRQVSVSTHVPTQE